MYIFAVTSTWVMIWAIAAVVVGLSAVIFVHELGHFVVAKLCGVRCDKFYLGFDVPIKIGPLRLPSALFKKQWGETEYGIGILPLGGYVKMLGQDDNPAKISEEMKRAQTEAEGETETKEIIGPDGESYRVHLRSYLAKNVPQRMAIISAGVFMNLVFAFVFAVIAYGVGVPYMPCIVSGTIPGSPAWEANLNVGDEIVQLEDKKNPTFTELRGDVTLGDLEQGIKLSIREPGKSELRHVTLKPRQSKNGKGLASIGISAPHSLLLNPEMPVAPFTSAAGAQRVTDPAGADPLAQHIWERHPSGATDASSATEDSVPATAVSAPGTADSVPTARPRPQTGFQGNDRIISVDNRPVKDWRDLSKILATDMDQTLNVTVLRGDPFPENEPTAMPAEGKKLTFAVAPQPFKRFGLIMKIGEVIAVQQDSPAAQQGIQPGDYLLSMNGEPIGDPIEWPDRVLQFARDNKWIHLEVNRPSKTGKEESISVEMMPRVPDWIDTPQTTNSPMSCPALGIAYHVQSVVHRVVPNSPADKSGLQSFDEIVEAAIEIGQDDTRDIKFGKIKFSEEARNWPYFMQVIQSLSPQSQITLTVKRGDEQKEIILKPYIPQATGDLPAMYHVDRGFVFEPIRRIRHAESLADGLRMGWNKTTESLGLVFRFLRKIGGQVPITAMGGPIMIAKASYFSVLEGPGQFLVFLTILSANLAVLNFLPIPLLDGGHMLFLAYEGVRGRPPRERLVVALHMIGFIFIIGLMLFVFALDLGIIPRNL